MRFPQYFGLFLSCLSFIACGGATTEDTTTSASEAVNTEKLIGTPFEGMTIGDEVPTVGYFLCGQYQTTVINEFPIKIFAAFFSEEGEQKIADGINIANTAMGFAAYELTDTWSDDVRVIYSVSGEFLRSLAPEAIAVTIDVSSSFNDKNFSDNESPDWVIFIKSPSPGANLVAHELGHASGIMKHMLIDYENDMLLDLEANSIMSPIGGGLDPAAMTDYNFMMQKQGELMQQHLGEKGSAIVGTWCD